MPFDHPAIIIYVAILVSAALASVPYYILARGIWPRPRKPIVNQYTGEIQGLRDGLTSAMEIEVNLREQLRKAELQNSLLSDLVKVNERQSLDFAKKYNKAQAILDEISDLTMGMHDDDDDEEGPVRDLPGALEDALSTNISVAESHAFMRTLGLRVGEDSRAYCSNCEREVIGANEPELQIPGNLTRHTIVMIAGRHTCSGSE